ncbi:hypothetical protein GCM10023313_11950 [Mucilaginibacter defluvii]|uniref:DUF1345 domain-containing protein n=2 Tax=Mucilaginibacter defluvii TaxID=1196019 RepID=A0ABP9FNC4_9SPHI
MLTWLGFCSTHLLFSWLTITACSADQIRETARKQDTGRAVISVFMLVATSVCFLALAILMSSIKGFGKDGLTGHILLAIASVFGAWLLIHTNFVFRYAHLYYSGSRQHRDTTGGLVFPEEEAPDYFDFTYFSFVIGTTFQVSDVAITSKKIRRVVLLHGLLSFAFNTVIVALSINMVSGIAQQ